MSSYLLGQGQISHGLPFKGYQVLHLTHPYHKPSIVESHTSASLSPFLRVLFSGFLSRQLHWGWVGCCLSQSPSMFPYLNCESIIINKSSFLAFYSEQKQGSQMSTWFLLTGYTMNIHVHSGIKMGHRPYHGPWWRYRPRTLIQFPETVGPCTSTWHPAATRMTNIDTASW